MHFSKLAVIASTVALASAAPSKKAKRAGNFEFFGVNESGAEFGNLNLPGVLGTDYTWPLPATIDTLVADGMNIFRIALMMERLVPDTLTGSLDATYLADLKEIVSYITGKGAYAIVDPHNFARYYGEVITDTAGFEAWWKTVAAEFASDSNVIFDCNNEPHDMPSIDLVVELNQGCINGIRAAGATTQTIFVEGTSYSGAWTWTTSGNDALSALTDPSDKIVYEMHQYLDSDGSGTSEDCVSATIGQERVQAATEWLQANGKKGIIGEFAGGANDQCKSAVTGMLTYMAENTDAWVGALWWGGGPWWGDYMYSMEPPSGVGYTYYIDTLKTLG
ncbi:hypothetical protein V490_04201 [Pseudogymnoascus sp. VKM F-3557]|nr:hypothetical protein V490_04201 [Pseudogymnoascus sp. VKM F-3557]